MILADGDHLMEVTFADRGIRVYLMDAQGEEVSVAGTRGSVLLKPRRGRRKTVPLVAVPPRGGPGGFLVGEADLSGVRDGSRTAVVTVDGVGGGPRRLQGFTRFVRTPEPGDLPISGSGDGAEHGHGHGHGSGDGSGHGHGHAHGSGDGAGHGHGHAHGSGSGDGGGHGHGRGSGGHSH